MLNKFYFAIFWTILWLVGCPGLAQNTDSLSDDTIYQMKKGAERALQDYNAAMRELINPRISKSYRDRIVAEFTTPGNRQIFAESAYVVYDYDRDYLPPLETKERPVKTYLNDFNIFHQGTSSQQTLEVYYSLQKIHDILRDEEGYFTIVDFESLYGSQLPQPRRATMRLQTRGERWEALISYVKFNIEQDEPDEGPAEESASAAEVIVPWLALAERADSLLQNNSLAEAKVLIDSSLALQTDAYNTKLAGRYYQLQDDLPEALAYYQQSLSIGEENDPAYEDEITRRLITGIKAELSRPEPTPRSDTTVTELLTGRFRPVEEHYTRGKEYRIQWETETTEPVTLQLFREGGQGQPLQTDLAGTEYTWRVPKDLEKRGGYRFHLSTASAGGTIESGTFRIKKRTPWGLYLGVTVAAAAAATYFLWPDPAPTSESGGLVDPPGLPAN